MNINYLLTNVNSLCPPLASVTCPRFIIVVQCVWRWRKNIVNLQCNYCALCKIINMLTTCLDFWMFTTQHWWWKKNVEIVLNMFTDAIPSSLIDSNVSMMWKQRKSKKLATRSLTRITSGVEGRVGVSGWD
jgi:hypothetical protein